MKQSLNALDKLLAREGGVALELKETAAAKKMHGARTALLEHLQQVSQSANLPLIIATERTIIEGDLGRYTNSQPMANSLKNALAEIAAIERHIEIVDDREKYKAVDQAHSLLKNRKGGLPYDEARQALSSHYTRLNNLDKSRLDDDEKRIIDTRKSAIFVAGKLYAERKAKSLGIELAQRGNRL